MDISTIEVLLLLIVCLLIWGRRLPEAARKMGEMAEELSRCVHADRTSDEWRRVDRRLLIALIVGFTAASPVDRNEQTFMTDETDEPEQAENRL